MERLKIIFKNKLFDKNILKSIRNNYRALGSSICEMILYIKFFCVMQDFSPLSFILWIKLGKDGLWLEHSKNHEALKTSNGPQGAVAGNSKLFSSLRKLDPSCSCKAPQDIISFSLCFCQRHWT